MLLKKTAAVKRCDEYYYKLATTINWNVRSDAREVVGRVHNSTAFASTCLNIILGC